MRTKHSHYHSLPSHAVDALNYDGHNTENPLAESTDAEIDLALACLENNTRDIQAIKAIMTLTGTYRENTLPLRALRIAVAVNMTSTNILRRHKAYQHTIIKDALSKATGDIRYKRQNVVLLIKEQQKSREEEDDT